MTIRPKTPTDLTLAPVAVEVDLNLQRLRDLASPSEIFQELALELNLGHPGATPEERAAQILRFAVRNVELHGWQAETSADATRIHLHGGSVTLEIGLSAGLQGYING
jgi:hypothetical protein